MVTNDAYIQKSLNGVRVRLFWRAHDRVDCGVVLPVELHVSLVDIDHLVRLDGDEYLGPLRRRQGNDVLLKMTVNIRAARLRPQTYLS